MRKKYTIAHITSVHPRSDTRIFARECISLQDRYKVILIVADGKGDESYHGVSIYDVGKPSSRVNRILFTRRNILRKALELGADIFHAHDPELMPVLIKLRRMGSKVIFDAHEDFPKQILDKPYLNRYFEKVLSKMAHIYQKRVSSLFHGVVSATNCIEENFLATNSNTILVNNFPDLAEIKNYDNWNSRKNICYIGAISLTRGIKELVSSLPHINPKHGKKILTLGGEFPTNSLRAQITNEYGFEHVEFLGRLNRKEVDEVLSQSLCGMVTLHPTKAYLDSNPVKMFEYMAAGIPVIASKFPRWQKIVESGECGICVNPLDSKEIARAVEYLFEHPEKAKKNGRKWSAIGRNKIQLGDRKIKAF